MKKHDLEGPRGAPNHPNIEKPVFFICFSMFLRGARGNWPTNSCVGQGLGGTIILTSKYFANC